MPENTYLVKESSLTQVADAIRAKGGTSAPLAYPTGFVSAIGDIPTGGDNLFNHVTRLGSLFNKKTDLPHKISIVPTRLDSGNINGYFLSQAYENGHNDATMEIEFTFNQTTSFSLQMILWQAYGVKKAKFSGNLQYVTSYMNAFQSYLGDELDILIDFTSCTNNDHCAINTSTSSYSVNTTLTRLLFKENTGSYSINIVGFSALDDVSLASVANCMVAGVSGKSLKLHATPKARCSTLMGNNNNGTFEINEQGSMSLETFITTVKGWTLA